MPNSNDSLLISENGIIISIVFTILIALLIIKIIIEEYVRRHKIPIETYPEIPALFKPKRCKYDISKLENTTHDKKCIGDRPFFDTYPSPITKSILKPRFFDPFRFIWIVVVLFLLVAIRFIIYFIGIFGTLFKTLLDTATFYFDSFLGIIIIDAVFILITCIILAIGCIKYNYFSWHTNYQLHRYVSKIMTLIIINIIIYLGFTSYFIGIIIKIFNQNELLFMLWFINTLAIIMSLNVAMWFIFLYLVSVESTLL